MRKDLANHGIDYEGHQRPEDGVVLPDVHQEETSPLGFVLDESAEGKVSIAVRKGAKKRQTLLENEDDRGRLTGVGFIDVFQCAQLADGQAVHAIADLVQRLGEDCHF